MMITNTSPDSVEYRGGRPACPVRSVSKRKEHLALRYRLTFSDISEDTNVFLCNGKRYYSRCSKCTFSSASRHYHSPFLQLLSSTARTDRLFKESHYLFGISQVSCSNALAINTEHDCHLMLPSYSTPSKFSYLTFTFAIGKYFSTKYQNMGLIFAKHPSPVDTQAQHLTFHEMVLAFVVVFRFGSHRH